MDIEQFMQGYKAAWEGRDERLFCALFAEGGAYHNTPFAVQRGHAQLADYWQRVKLQEDVALRYEVLAATPGAGVAHWHVTCQVASEELFAICADREWKSVWQRVQELAEGMNEMAQLLESRGFIRGHNLFVSEDPAGGHNEAAWARHSGEWLKVLFGR